jgi:serine/threonine protein phosphatase 1
MMQSRTIAIGDIHGCTSALRALLDAIAPTRADTIVLLGDYIDRGPDSKGALDLVIALAGRCRVVPLLGNHEEMLLAALSDRNALKNWLACGGVAALRSYGWAPGGPRRALANLIPVQHQRFLSGCRPFHETQTHLFLHAGYVPELPITQQPGLALRWRATDALTATPHCSGKVVIVGHTPQKSGEVLDLGFLVCIDTNCWRGGWLTALETGSGCFWQANEQGEVRERALRSRT